MLSFILFFGFNFTKGLFNILRFSKFVSVPNCIVIIFGFVCMQTLYVETNVVKVSKTYDKT